MPSYPARAVNALLAKYIKPQWRPDLDVVALRRRVERTDRMLGGMFCRASISFTMVGGIPCHWIEAVPRPQRTLLYLHGGAWCVHLPRSYQQFAARLSRLFNARVLLPDYRLAPEHPFPAQFDDCLAVYRGILDLGAGLGPLIVGGDSAGGQLTLALLIAARDAGLRLPNCAFALSPATCFSRPVPSQETNAQHDVMFQPAALPLIMKAWLPEGQDLSDPRISPVEANLAGLPPIHIDASRSEMLVDHATLIADKIRQDGGKVELDLWDDLPHVFQLLAILPESRQALAKLANFVDRHIE